MFFCTVKLKELIIDAYNPRIHDRLNIDLIKDSLIRNGQYRPFVVQKSTRRIIVGNGMYQAMRALNIEEAQAVMLELDDVKARALSILDNRAGDTSSFIESDLAEYLRSIPEEMLVQTGFTADDLELLASEAEAAGENYQRSQLLDNVIAAKFVFGKLIFYVPADTFRVWKKELIESAGSSEDAQKAELSNRIGLEAYDEN